MLVGPNFLDCISQGLAGLLHQPAIEFIGKHPATVVFNEFQLIFGQLGLGICLGNVYKEVEVNLEDRSKFNYQLLIGRSYLKNSFLVDASATFTLKPNCQVNGNQ